ncbi:hypothetical protein IPC1147_30490 [Pseudomonas aeruginosa]|nr:hypothetical protein AXW86_31310 [Pseudomonas aeruginosa]RQC69752.1 hypothetical protein IPC353_30285 [Pseudomonas aeruginosa]RQH92686.1 hypothetical protein IPC98_33865 [Pseudomonas aeruginosa]RRS17036.1 hypothetical protein IPC1107_31045 [Pseudomonas aeruginosa]RRS19463.1 hypothetical protein IPC1147_30490 [Pseudomonas aeruginosa]
MMQGVILLSETQDTAEKSWDLTRTEMDDNLVIPVDTTGALIATIYDQDRLSLRTQSCFKFQRT